MTRVAVIVSMWFLLVGAIGDEVLAGGSARSLGALLALGLGASAVTWAALWLQFSREAPADAPGAHPPWRID